MGSLPCSRGLGMTTKIWSATKDAAAGGSQLSAFLVAELQVLSWEEIGKAPWLSPHHI